MQRAVEQLLQPEVVWVLIPLIAIAFWGTLQLVRAFRRAPGDWDEWKAELDDLRTRVNELERRQGGPVNRNNDDRITARR
ncbi:MAG TPA: hypothetical protein VGZ47_16390 [Gemmataceae bacterium]|jgi:hypothetical protein|nr:hypothetical protein [Gemmataceae bacterium]